MASRNHAIVTEENWAETIRRWSKHGAVEEIGVAVGYCGADAYRFFPERDRAPRLRFLVDFGDEAVKLGLTNPGGITRLKAVGEVRSLPCLHAKTIIFGGEAALVGSTNLSASSVTQQFQCGLITTLPRTVSALWTWFEDLWDQGDPVTSRMIKRAEALAPSWTNGRGRTSRGPQLPPDWKHPPHDVPLEEGDFKDTLSARDAKRALHRFRTTECGYCGPDDDFKCAEVSRKAERNLRPKTKTLRDLVRRLGRWSREDRESFYRIATTHGPALGKKFFMRAPGSRLAKSLEFLFLEKSVDPFIRFEQVSIGRYRIPGLRQSRIAMLMHAWMPKTFALWNHPVEKGLRLLGFEFPRGNRLAQKYKDRTAALRSIQRRFRFPSLAYTDHFVEAFGKRHIRL